MNDEQASREQLLEALADLRQRVAVLEQREADVGQGKEVYDHVMDLSPVLLCVAGLDGYFKQVNPAFTRILGYTEEELLSQSAFEIIHPDDHAASKAHLEKLAAGEPLVNFENRNVCKDGTYRWLSWTVVPRPEQSVVYGIAHDITELKQSAEALRASEARYKTLVDTIPHGIREIDSSGTITLANVAHREMYGYTEEEMVGKSIWSLLANDSEKPKLQEYLKHVVEDQPPRTPYITKNQTKDGRIIDIQVDWDYKRDEKGQVTGFSSVITDFTERRKAERALKESERFNRTIISSVAEGVIVYDRELRYRVWNEFMEQLSGVPAKEVLGRPALELFPHLREQGVDKLLRRALNGETVRSTDIEYLIPKTGKRAWVVSVYSPHVNSDGEIIGVVGTVREITKRKEAEEALAASEAKWRSLVENAPNVILTVERDGRIIFINRTFSGRSREEVIARRVYEFVPAEYHDRIKTGIEKVFETGEAASFEVRAPGEYGSLWVANRVGPVKRDGQVVAATIISTDVTEQKQMEEALQEAHDQLEERVKKRTAELATANSRQKEEVEERKRAEEALRDSEEQFRALFESTNDAVMLLDENEFFECNDATLGIFGCSTRDQFIGKHPSELSPPMQPDGTDSQTAARAKIALAIETGRAQFEWLHCRADGVEFFADVLLSSMELKGQTVLQAVVRDISQRKRAEEAVLRERATLRRLLESSDRERKLTAYEIHDGFTQHIAGAKMQLEAASKLKDENPEAAAEAYQRGLELLTWGMDEARRLISGLRPPILDEAGVVAAIEHLVHDPSMQEGPEVGFVFDAKFGRLEPLLENAIFRIVQESVTNARRYSESSKVQVRLTQQDNRICIEVEDWGIGFDPDEITETSFGIGGIRERARLLGGRATIDSTPGKGTLVRVELPLVESG